MLARDDAPVAEPRPHEHRVSVAGGKEHVLMDEYAWLRGKAWPKLVEDEDILAHLAAENAYCKDYLASLGDRRGRFFEKLRGRIKLSDRTLERRRGEWCYYTRTEEALQYSIDCRKRVKEGDGGTKVMDDAAEEEVILDRNKLAEGKEFCKALGTTASLDGRLCGYRFDDRGDENYLLNFKRLDGTAGEEEFLPDRMYNVASYCYRETPAADGEVQGPPSGIFYSLRNENLRSTKVFYHRFGDAVTGTEDFDPKGDRLLFESKNEMYTVYVGKTSDERFVIVRHASKTENEIYAIAMADEEMEMTCLKPLAENIEYSVDKNESAWVMKTKDGCKKDHWRLCASSSNLKGLSDDFAWDDLVCEKQEYCLEGFEVTKGYLGLKYLNVTNGMPLALCMPLSGAEVADEDSMAFDPATYKQFLFPGIHDQAPGTEVSHDATFSHTSSYEYNILNVAVDTPVTPTIWYKYNLVELVDGALTDVSKLKEMIPVLKQKEVPDYDESQYETVRFYATYQEDIDYAIDPSLHADPKYVDLSGGSPKGLMASIPVTVFYKKSHFKRDGTMPLLLNGYGSYGYPMEPCWRNTNALYADLGFCVATAHIRGGGDLGEPWYQSAKFLSKKRTFADFVACADKLAEEGYASPGNVAIVGGSAGGMLVGACMAKRPDLFKAVVAHVPFVTVLDTMLDGDLPLTPGEFKEWGNPRDEHYFEYMKSYCPYENCGYVKDFVGAGKAHPSIFATAGLSDYRVGYYEAAKWIARIRQGVKRAKAEGGAAVAAKEPLILFETNMAAGHGGASGRFDRLKEVARDMAFLATEFGVSQAVLDAL